MNIPRQPFVGLALMAAFGIVVADFFPIAASRWWFAAIAFALLTIPLCCWPNLGSTYLLVGCGFFLLHNFRIGDTAGLQLATDLSDRPVSFGKFRLGRFSRRSPAAIDRGDVAGFPPAGANFR